MEHALARAELFELRTAVPLLSISAASRCGVTLGHVLLCELHRLAPEWSTEVLVVPLQLTTPRKLPPPGHGPHRPARHRTVTEPPEKVKPMHGLRLWQTATQVMVQGTRIAAGSILSFLTTRKPGRITS